MSEDSPTLQWFDRRAHYPPFLDQIAEPLPEAWLNTLNALTEEKPTFFALEGISDTPENRLELTRVFIQTYLIPKHPELISGDISTDPQAILRYRINSTHALDLLTELTNGAQFFTDENGHRHHSAPLSHRDPKHVTSHITRSTMMAEQIAQNLVACGFSQKINLEPNELFKSPYAASLHDLTRNITHTSKHDDLSQTLFNRLNIHSSIIAAIHHSVPKDPDQPFNPGTYDTPIASITRLSDLCGKLINPSPEILGQIIRIRDTELIKSASLVPDKSSLMQMPSENHPRNAWLLISDPHTLKAFSLWVQRQYSNRNDPMWQGDNPKLFIHTYINREADVVKHHTDQWLEQVGFDWWETLRFYNYVITTNAKTPYYQGIIDPAHWLIVTS